MSFFSTALSSVGSFVSDLSSTVGSIINDASPLISAGLEVAGAFGALPSPRSPSRAPAQTGSAGGVSAMPGGAVTAFTRPLPRATPAVFGGTSVPFQSSSLMMPANLPGVVDRFQGQVGSITPIPTAGGLRLPRIVHTLNPNDPNKIETYVRAPRPRYKVSVSGPRKRCRGGR